MAVLALIWLVGLTLSAFANEFHTINGISWEYRISNGEAFIEGFSPKAASISIPAELGGCPVTRINCYMVSSDRTVVEINLPSTVRWLMYANRNNPFAGSYALQRINVAADNPFFTSSDGVLYSKDKTVLHAFPGAKTSVAFPQRVCEIGPQAFQGSALTDVDVPSSVTTIGMAAFDQCRNLESVTLHDGLVSIGTRAFGWNYALKAIAIPETIAELPDALFKNCGGLEYVSLPSGLKVIGSGAFSGCTSLRSITIPRGVARLWDNTFKDCRSLEDVTYLPKFAPSEYAFSGTWAGCTFHVCRDSYGWGVSIPGKWHEYGIVYVDEEPQHEPLIPPNDRHFADWLMNNSFKFEQTPDELFDFPAENPAYTLAEAYVAGLDPRDPEARFAVVIKDFNSEDGYVKEVGWEPQLDETGTARRRYTILGKKSLSDPGWFIVDGNCHEYRFFKAFVELRRQ